LGYEKAARERVESDLEHEKSEGQSQRTALREQLRRLESELDQARGHELPHDWPTVKRIWLEGTMFKQSDQRSRRALRAAQSMIEVLQDQLSSVLTEVSAMHRHVAALEQQHMQHKHVYAEAQRSSDRVCDSMRHQVASAQGL
jgi:predicted  nucleic acid-binding Zn-ribbon protein